jgi:hypothetical protein
MDRCFLIARPGDYEDILLNRGTRELPLLELRALDSCWTYGWRKRRRSCTPRSGAADGSRADPPEEIRPHPGPPLRGPLHPRNLENSSKIIGDFYLCQIYDRLCGSSTPRAGSAPFERRAGHPLLGVRHGQDRLGPAPFPGLEIIFIAVCVILPVLQIWQALLLD